MRARSLSVPLFVAAAPAATPRPRERPPLPGFPPSSAAGPFGLRERYETGRTAEGAVDGGAP